MQIQWCVFSIYYSVKYIIRSKIYDLYLKKTATKYGNQKDVGYTCKMHVLEIWYYLLLCYSWVKTVFLFTICLIFY